MQTYDIKDLVSRLTLQQFWGRETCNALKDLTRKPACLQKGQALPVNRSLWRFALFVKGGRQ